MAGKVAVLLGCTLLATACGGASPTSPSPSAASARAPRLLRTRFMAFGDSFTSGEVTAPLAATGGISKLVVVPSASYPTVLQSQLQSGYPSQSDSISVSNMGRGGETIFDGVLRFGDVFGSARPEVVLLLEGVNGLAFAGPDASTSLMRSMVQQAKNGSARVFVGSMIPTLPNRQRSQTTSELVAYNAALRAMCSQEGVTYVDLYNGILPDAEQLIGIDGLHPTEAGYRRMADLFFAAIRATLQE